MMYPSERHSIPTKPPPPPSDTNPDTEPELLPSFRLLQFKVIAEKCVFVVQVPANVVGTWYRTHTLRIHIPTCCLPLTLRSGLLVGYVAIWYTQYMDRWYMGVWWLFLFLFVRKNQFFSSFCLYLYYFAVVRIGQNSRFFAVLPG